MTECSAVDCANEAVFALWLDDKEEFSCVVVASEDSDLKAGDRNPTACPDHKSFLEAKYRRLGEFRRIDDDA